MNRIQKNHIIKDLQKKMVFIVGPRQAGKTWLAKDIAKEFNHPLYLNYDSIEDQKLIKSENWSQKTDLLILDELHKMPGWKNYLKGLFDTLQTNTKILVTGSARMGIYQHMGDSLAGRFFLHHLMPYSPSELTQLGEACSLDKIAQRSGFPEPYLSETLVDANRWRMQYIESLIRIDVLDFENIKNLRAMQLVFDLLRTKVGSPVSYQSIAEDVGVSLNTVKKYILVLEALYIVFRVTPFSNNIARSILKEPKIYFFDNGLVKGDQGAIFENLVANCLLKHVYAKIDYEAEPYKLQYLRNKDGREVDFALVNDKKIEKIIEVKTKSNSFDPSLLWYAKKYQLKAVQIVKSLKHNIEKESIEMIQAIDFLKTLLL